MATATEYIIAIESKNVDKIADFKLTLSEEFKPFIVLTGDNGAGKTWLLKCMALALSNQTSFLGTQKQEEKFITHLNNRQTAWRVLPDAYFGKTPMEWIANNYAAYGASRLAIKTRERMAEERGSYGEPPILDINKALNNIEYWLQVKMLAKRSHIIAETQKVLIQLLPNVEKIEYEIDDKEGVVFHYYTENQKERLTTLSAGNRVVLATIGDMLTRLWDQQLGIREAKDLEGIVIIDELEAHLHPEWQRKFPKLLHEIFPKVQFVISTHTPMTILGLPKDCILLHVDTNEEGKITVEKQNLDYWNMLPQQILTAPLFGLNSLRSLYHEELDQLHTEEDYDQLLKRKEVQENMKEMLRRLNEKRGKEGA